MTRIPEELRTLVIERAAHRCEYCLIHDSDTIKHHEIDHIRAEKHGGQTQEANLCYSCLTCNRHKGSDVTSYDPETDEITPLFNPREDDWAEHFNLRGAKLEPLTAKARATVFLLQLNADERLIERATLIRLKRYPR